LSTKILLTKADDASAALNAYRASAASERELAKLDEFAAHLDEVSSQSIFNVIEEDGYAVVRGEDKTIIAKAWLGSENELNIFMKTKNTEYQGKGRLVFKKLFNYINSEYEEIKAIRGTWRQGESVGDNLNTFNELISKGINPNVAAMKTFTGKMAKELQYTNTTILTTSIRKVDGTYSSVDIIFKKQ
jgi:hypothetical protein